MAVAGGIQSGNCCQNTSIKLGTTRVCSFPLSAVGQGLVAGTAVANVHCELGSVVAAVASFTSAAEAGLKAT